VATPSPPPVDPAKVCEADRAALSAARAAALDAQDALRACSGQLAAETVRAETTDCTRRVNQAVQNCAKFYQGRH